MQLTMSFFIFMVENNLKITIFAIILGIPSEYNYTEENEIKNFHFVIILLRQHKVKYNRKFELNVLYFITSMKMVLEFEM